MPTNADSHPHSAAILPIAYALFFWMLLFVLFFSLFLEVLSFFLGLIGLPMVALQTLLVSQAIYCSHEVFTLKSYL